MRERTLKLSICVAGWSAVLLLAACAEGGGTAEVLSSRLIGPAKPDNARIPAPSGSLRDGGRGRIAPGANRKMANMIEAPDLFSDTRELSWSGNDTLGGLWIAHGGIERAYRVRATNLRTGVVVDGALLPRHGQAQGTAREVLLSREAAESLGILPGRPEEVALVAILPAPLESPPEIMVADATSDSAGEPDEAEGSVPVATESETVAAAPAVAAPVMEVAEPGPDIDLAALDGTDAFATPVAEDAAAAAEPDEPPAPVPTRTAPRAAEPKANPKPVTEPTTQTAAAQPGELGAAETRQARPRPQETARPAPETAATRTATPRQSETAAATEMQAAAKTETSGEGPADGKPFVVSGALKTNDLAADLVRTLSAYGIAAQNVTDEGEGEHRVIAGPFRSDADRDNALNLFRAIGVYGARAAAG